MNNDRKKTLMELQLQLIKLAGEVSTAAAAWSKRLEEIKDDVSSQQEDEQESFDNLSEGLQQSENGQKAEAAASELGECVSELESKIADLDAMAVDDWLQEAVDHIDSATE